MLTDPYLSRRELLSRVGSGFGLLALADLLAAGTSMPTTDSSDRAAQPYAVRQPHHAPHA
jgi:hypothetical protein